MSTIKTKTSDNIISSYAFSALPLNDDDLQLSLISKTNKHISYRSTFNLRDLIGTNKSFMTFDSAADLTGKLKKEFETGKITIKEAPDSVEFILSSGTQGEPFSITLDKNYLPLSSFKKFKSNDKENLPQSATKTNNITSPFKMTDTKKQITFTSYKKTKTQLEKVTGEHELLRKKHALIKESFDKTLEMNLILTKRMEQKESSYELDLVKKWLPSFNNISKLYQATKDGFSASRFHSLCDEKGPTLVIITSETGRKFGGFTVCEWRSRTLPSIEEDSSGMSFIFSVDKCEKFPLMHKNFAIYNNRNYGPCFGGDYSALLPGYFTSDLFDICIRNEADKNSESSSSFPYCYNTNYEQTFKNRKVLAGKEKFKVNEIEVYAVLLDFIYCD